MMKEEIEFVESELVEKDYREFVSDGYDEDAAQIAWCRKWKEEHETKKLVRRAFWNTAKRYFKLTLIALKRAVKGR